MTKDSEEDKDIVKCEFDRFHCKNLFKANHCTSNEKNYFNFKTKSVTLKVCFCH